MMGMLLDNGNVSPFVTSPYANVIDLAERRPDLIIFEIEAD